MTFSPMIDRTPMTEFSITDAAADDAAVADQAVLHGGAAQIREQGR